MKKLLLVILLFNSVRLFAQTPDWIWANSAGGNGVDEGNSVATDATGNMIATGYFKSDSITFGTTVLINSDSSSLTQDFFIVKYDSSGNVLWAKSAGGGNDDKGKGVAIDLSGNIIVTGSFRSDTITFGSYLLANAGNENIFIVKYDPSGNILWSKSAGGTGFYDAANSITTDGDGNIIIAGDFGSNSIPFGTTYLYNFGAINGFVVKYDSLGNVLWAKSVGGSGEETISSVTTDPTGNIIIAGGFNSPSFNLGGITLSTNGVSDAFIVKYDPMGNVLWAKSAGGNNEDVVRSLTTDISGNVIAVGAFLSPIITFSSILLSNPNVIYSIVFIVKYDSLGNALWAKKIGGNFISQGVFGTSITNNSIGNIIVSGYFKADSVRIGTTMLYNYGGWTDIFIAEYNSSGNVLWAKSAGGNFYDVANSITCHNDGSIIITGSFYDLYCYFGSITLMNANWISSPDFFIAKLDTVSITKIKEHIHNNSMNIFPNPTTSQINITSFFIIDKIEITNVMGQIIYSAMPKDKNFKMEIKKEGIYFVTVFANDERISRKVVVHH